MPWQTPELTEIDMSAEIGAYQSDFDGDFHGRSTRPALAAGPAASEPVSREARSAHAPTVTL